MCGSVTLSQRNDSNSSPAPKVGPAHATLLGIVRLSIIGWRLGARVKPGFAIFDIPAQIDGEQPQQHEDNQEDDRKKHLNHPCSQADCGPVRIDAAAGVAIIHDHRSITADRLDQALV